MNWKLVTEDGVPIDLGARVRTFRGDWVIVKGFTPPHKPSSSGRVLLKTEGMACEAEYYPGVIRARIVQQ